MVATPEMPLMLMWAPLVPSTKSRSSHTGSLSLESPAARRLSTSSKSSAASRSFPDALRTSAPGSGGTNVSGTTRVSWIMAASVTSAGKIPSAMRKTSLSKRAPSCRALT